MTAPATVALLVRPATGADDALRHRLFADSRPELTVIEPETRQPLLDLQWRAQARQQGIEHPSARREIIELNGTPVGQLVVDDAEAVTRLVDIAVAAEHRRRGIARQVLADLLATDSGRAVDLCVWSDNLAARRLYEELGFGYVTHGDENLHMRCESKADTRR